MVLADGYITDAIRTEWSSIAAQFVVILKRNKMGNAVHLRRPLTGVVLEQVRQHAERSWFGQSITPNRIVIELVEKVEQLHKELVQAKLDAEIYEGMYDTKYAMCEELLVKLGQTYSELMQLWDERNSHTIKSEAQLTNIREAVDWLWGFWDGNSLRAIPGFEDGIREAWDRLLAAVDI